MPLISFALLFISVVLDPFAFNISSLILSMPVFYLQHQGFLVTHEPYYAKSSYRKKLFLLCSLNWRYYNYLKQNVRCFNGMVLMVMIVYCSFNLYAIGNQYRKQDKAGQGFTNSQFYYLAATLISLCFIVHLFLIYFIRVINLIFTLFVLTPIAFVLERTIGKCFKLKLFSSDFQNAEIVHVQNVQNPHIHLQNPQPIINIDVNVIDFDQLAAADLDQIQRIQQNNMHNGNENANVDSQRVQLNTIELQGKPSVKVQENLADIESQEPQILRQLSEKTANKPGHIEVKCSICLLVSQCSISNFEKDKRKANLIELDCNSKHIFHRDCIIEWQKKKNECPLCRQKILILLN
eukprot:403334521